MLNNFNNDLGIFKKFSGLFLLKIFSTLLNFIFLLVITNKFSTDEVGSFFTSLAYLSFLALVSKFGIDIIVSKKIAENKMHHTNQDSLLISQSIILIIFLSIFFLFLFIIFDYFIYQVPNINIILIYSLPFYSLLLFYSTIYKAMDNQFMSMIFENIILNFLLIIIVFFLSDNMFHHIYINFYILILFCLFLSVYFFKINFDFNIPQVSTLSYLIKNGFYIFIPTLLTTSYGFIDIFMINHFAPISSVSIYSISSKISLLISFGVSILNSLLLPVVPGLIKQRKGRQVISEVTLRVKFILLSSIPIFLILIFFPKFILGFFGEDYIQGSISLIILSIFQFINVLTGGVTFVLLLSSIKKIVTLVLFASLLTNLLLNWFLIPVFFHDGAAFATAFSSIIACLVLFIVYYKHLIFLENS